MGVPPQEGPTLHGRWVGADPPTRDLNLWPHLLPAGDPRAESHGGLQWATYAAGAALSPAEVFRLAADAEADCLDTELARAVDLLGGSAELRHQHECAAADLRACRALVEGDVRDRCVCHRYPGFWFEVVGRWMSRQVS